MRVPLPPTMVYLKVLLLLFLSSFFSSVSSQVFSSSSVSSSSLLSASSKKEAGTDESIPEDWSNFIQHPTFLPCASTLFSRGNVTELDKLHAKKAAFATGKIIESLDLFALSYCNEENHKDIPNYCTIRSTKTMNDFESCIKTKKKKSNSTSASECAGEFPFVPQESGLKDQVSFLSSFGLHDACYQIPGYHYCSIEVVGQFWWKYGVCIPNVCNADDIKAGLEKLLVLQGKIDFGRHHPDVDLNQHDNNNDLKLYDHDGGHDFKSNQYVSKLFTSTCGDYTYPWTVGTTIMVVLCFGLVSFIIIGTFIEYTERQGQILAKKKGRSYENRDSSFTLICKCFSLITNGKLLLAPARGGAFDSFDGMRTFSMLWVIFGHTFVFKMTTLGFTNLADIYGSNNEGWVTTYPAQALTGGYFAVDTFFYMSGFLAMLMVMKTADELVMKKRKMLQYLKNIPLIYLQRFLRLTPTYFFILYMYLKVLPQMESGPFWNLFNRDSDSCNKYWWTNLLYINNLYPNNNKPECYGVTWYLANDFQFFLIVPFLGLLAVLVPKFYSIVLLLGGCLTSTIFAYIESYNNHWSINIFDPHYKDGYFSDYYMKPWYRCPPYLMGMLLAIVWYYYFDLETSPSICMQNRNQKLYAFSDVQNSPDPENEMIDEVQVSLLQNSSETSTITTTSKIKTGNFESPEKTTRCRDFMKRNVFYQYTLLLVALFLFAITVLGAQGAYTNVPPDWSDKTMSFYIAFSKPAWTLGLCILSSLLFVGELPLISMILNNRLMAILGRLTFCAYLIHPSIMLWFYYSADYPEHFSDIWYAMTFLSVVTAVFIVSIFVHLAVERPVANLDRLLRGGGKKTNTKYEKQKSANQHTNHGQFSVQDNPQGSQQQHV